MSEIFKTPKTYAADLEHAYKTSKDAKEMAAAVCDITARFISDTENQFYALENSRIILRLWIREAALTQRPPEQLARWLDTVRPAQKELGETRQCQIALMTRLVSRMIQILQAYPGSELQLAGLWHNHGQLQELASQARSRSAAWSTLFQTIQEALSTRLAEAALAVPDLRHLRAYDVLRAAEKLLRVVPK